MSRKNQHARNKQRKELRRKRRERKNRQLGPAKLSHKLTERLADAYDLIDCGDYHEAEKLLKKLDIRGANHAEVVEALLFLYQTTGNREGCCQAAERLTKLRPSDAEARIMYAQESMLCGRASIALLQYQEFLERWPEHAHAPKAKEAIEVLVPETERRIRETAFPAESAMQLCVLHEESLALLQRGEYVACAEKCKDLLVKAPNFAAARNNLAIAYFQSGRGNEAVAAVEETRQTFPNNRFAEATLAKLYFLTGRAAEAQPLADNIVANPPMEQDAIVIALEALAFLGRDEDVVHLAETVPDEASVDEQSQAIRLHYLAYAKCRLGDTKAATALWKQCLELSEQLTIARENLDDMLSDDGHAPWGAPLGEWIPRDVMDVLIDGMLREKHIVLAQYPAIAALIPALLDRGDPLGREVAVRFAMADHSSPMLSALKDFAFGSRGPDAMRFKVMSFLREQNVIDAGPHHVYNRGKWTDIQLLAAEITGEARPSGSSKRVLKLLEDGFYAMRENDFDTAETAFSDALKDEPGNCSAAYNLCTVWMRRDGVSGERRARPHLEQLHREHPDYAFAAIALALFAAGDGEYQRARELLTPCYRTQQLHISEATALFSAQAQIALDEGDIDAAERALDMLCDITDEDDPHVVAVRYRIDKASRKRGLRRLFAWA